MRLINIILVFFLVNITFSFSCVFANSGSQDNGDIVKISDDVINYIKRNIAISTIDLSASIKFCEKKREKVVLLDTKLLKEMNVTRNDVIMGFIYLDYINTFKCQKDAQLKFAYDIGMLVSVQRYYKLGYQETLDIASGLIYPSVEGKLEYIVKYSKLSPELKKYLEKIIGDKPFNLVGSVGKIELPRQ